LIDASGESYSYDQANPGTRWVLGLDNTASRSPARTASPSISKREPATNPNSAPPRNPELARQFVGDAHTNLFGTLSLWQGLDVPGETCQLVIIDRIPFPWPDDPLMSARQPPADVDDRRRRPRAGALKRLGDG
jgi:hypothetical protein